tara:strand:- start:3046 stop:3453 length:408 start_codon:yes stop_codon:yes gene_type:complete
MNYQHSSVTKLRIPYIKSITFDPNFKFKNQNTDILMQRCGLIPSFFNDCLRLEYDNLEDFTKEFDCCYGYGGFHSYPWKGKLGDNNEYISEFEDEEPLQPLVVFTGNRYECIVYKYGVTAIRDTETNETKVARID